MLKNKIKMYAYDFDVEYCIIHTYIVYVYVYVHVYVYVWLHGCMYVCVYGCILIYWGCPALSPDPFFLRKTVRSRRIPKFP